MRLHATKLVIAFGELLCKHAEEVAADTGHRNDAFFVDELAELLIWQVAEYLTAGRFDREDET